MRTTPPLGLEVLVRLRVVPGNSLQQAAFPPFLPDPVPVDEKPEAQDGRHGYQEGEHGGELLPK
jgi:hypothetical protein